MNDDVKLCAFRLHENLYFIGCEAVSVHLLDTEEGLVLIDTGYPDMLELILSNIEALGFSPKNIRALLHTHAHIDHFGTTRELVALSGATTYMSRIDNDIFCGPQDLTWAKELHLSPIPPFASDVLLEDGDTLTFGSTRVRCVLTPGHTAGTLSYVITLPDGTVAAMHGGGGMNSMRSDFLRRYGLSSDCRAAFRAALDRLRCERVDLVIGNHPGQSNTKGKMLRVLGGESDVRDGSEWARLLDSLEGLLDRLEAEDPYEEAKE